MPCHFIPLNESGETIDNLESEDNQQKLEEALKAWLRAKIKGESKPRAWQSNTQVRFREVRPSPPIIKVAVGYSCTTPDWKVKDDTLKDHKQKILVVDDEKMIRWSLGEALRGWGYEPVEAETASAALAAFDAEPPAAILLDINLPDGSGLDVLRQIRHRQPDAVVIMITANVLIDETIAALRGGAYDFIGKPINLEELQVAIRNGIEASRLRKEVKLFRRERSQQFSFDQIVGESPAIREMLALAQKVAASEVSSVLLQGESGTGKDLVAKAIHYQSTRAEEPFVAINCAALPGTLIESELFGYEKGAFTDAKARKEGLFEQAEGGTLFLDEIGELELSLQAKLLRVLEEGSFRRVGGLKDLPLDVRVIAASNRDLKDRERSGPLSCRSFLSSLGDSNRHPAAT